MTSYLILEAIHVMSGAVYPETLGKPGWPMNAKLKALPLDERIKLVEDLWNSIVLADIRRKL